MADPRRQFELPGNDTEVLTQRGLTWECVIEGGIHWLVLHEYPISIGYNVPSASTALQIPTSYPDTQIDMVYFCPNLARRDGKSIPQLSDQPFDGRTWQRWSRHRTEANPWRRGYDNVETHLLLVDEWLGRELVRAV